MTTSPRQFTVILRGPSSTVLGQDAHIRFQKFQSALGRVDVTYRTRWIGTGTEVSIPGHLVVEIVGEGEDLEQVLMPFANAGYFGLPLIALATNAAIPEPEIDVAFESTTGVSQRPYFQNYVPAERGSASTGRNVHVSAVSELIAAFSKHKEFDRLFRAANQYRLALDSWKLGRELLSLAHLWMSLEAITKVKVRRLCSDAGGITEPELAAKLGTEIKQLDAFVRKTHLLQGDEECYSKGKTASDGLEHGYLGYDQLHGYAKDVRHRLANLVRCAILDLLDLPAPVLATLTAEPYDKPLGHWPLARYLRGELLGNNPVLAAPGHRYPFVKWEPTISKSVPDGTGKQNVTFNESFTPVVAEGITFKALSVELWEPG